VRPIAAATGAALVTLAMCAWPVAAQKTDVVTLQNGNEITGEIKRLDRGRLEYSTDDMGTANIEWEHIQVLTSVSTFEFELDSGELFFGTLPEGAPPGSIIVGAVDPDTLSMTSIVRITPIEASFVERLSGFVDVGFSYTLANRETTLSGSGRVQYRSRRWETTVEGSSYFQAQEQIETITRNDLSVSLERFIGERGWSALLFGSAWASCSIGSASTMRSPHLERMRRLSAPRASSGSNGQCSGSIHPSSISSRPSTSSRASATPAGCEAMPICASSTR